MTFTVPIGKYKISFNGVELCDMVEKLCSKIAELEANSIPRADVEELVKALKAYSIEQHHGFQARTALESFNNKHGATK